MAISPELLRSILQELNATSAAIEASAIVSVDGLMLADAMPDNLDEDRVAAMSAAMLSLGRRTAEELQRGGIEQVMIKTNRGYTLMVAAGTDALLTVVAGNAAKLGLIFLNLKKTAALLEGFDLKPAPRMGLVALPKQT